ncbi:MAG: nucleotidyltransferase family protein [Pseudomonadota bacterium]
MSGPVEELVTLLRYPDAAANIAVDGWTDILCVARAEMLLATLGARLQDQPLPDAVTRIFTDVRRDCTGNQQRARWEANRAASLLAPLGITPILLKGTAYLASDHTAAQGRHIGDLDIMVPRAALETVEAALLGTGWEWVKDDPYDQAYYRQWMHELPPLIHQDRDAMIDVHHTILPLTARPMPDAGAMIARARSVGDGLAILDPCDMICHCAAHFHADGDMAGGLRNLWDFHLLISDFCRSSEQWSELRQRSGEHQLWPTLQGTLRLAHALYGTIWPPEWGAKWGLREAFFQRRLLARNGWGQETRPVTRLAIYIRSHWLRMPPLMLARHLWIKWRKGSGASA